MEIEEARKILIQVIEWENEKIIKRYDAEELGYALDICFAASEQEVVTNVIDKIVDIYPLHGRIIRIKALMLAKEKRDQDAIHLLSMVGHDDEYLFSCIELIGVIFINNYQFKKGIQTFNGLLKKIENADAKAFILHYRAICYQYLGDYVSAFNDSVNAAIQLFHEDNLFKEICMNMNLCILNGKVGKINEALKSFEISCLKINEEYCCYGSNHFLLELSFLRCDLSSSKKYLLEYKENCTERALDLQVRMDQMEGFFILLDEYKQIQSALDEIAIPKKTRQVLSKKQIDYTVNIKPEAMEFLCLEESYKKQLCELESKLREMSEDDFNLHDALKGIII